MTLFFTYIFGLSAWPSIVMAAKTLVQVCTECFEKVGKKKTKAPLLIERKCLDRSNHDSVPQVRVYLTEKGLLEPEIRPIPKVRFKGEFKMCPGEICRGQMCTFAHCYKEKATWNADKFGIDLASLGSTGTITAVEAANQASTAQSPPAIDRVLPQQLQGGSQIFQQPAQLQPPLSSPEPWPDFPGFGAQTMKQLQQATSPPMNPPPFGLPVVQPVRDVHPLPSEVLPVSPPKPPLPYALVAAPPQYGAVHRPSGPVPLPLAAPPKYGAVHRPSGPVPLPLAAQPQYGAAHWPSGPVPLHLAAQPQYGAAHWPSGPVPLPLAAPPQYGAVHRPSGPVPLPLAAPPQYGAVHWPSVPVPLPLAAPPQYGAAHRPSGPVPLPLAAQPQYGAAHRPSVPVPLPLSPPQPRQAPPKDAPSSGAMKRKFPQRRSSTAVMYESLEVRNYQMKFRELLESEKIAHEKLLKERCDGKYTLFLVQAGQKPGELKFEAKRHHIRFGYFKNMGSDEVSYATQSAIGAVIGVGQGVPCDILRENNFHAEERLYVAFTAKSFEALSSHFQIGKSPFESPNRVPVRFRLKYSYFRSLKEAIRDLGKYVIARILPKLDSFEPVQPLDGAKFEPYRKFCSPDQLEALKVIASSPASGPPVLISGPFGTGKTRVLAVAAHYFLHQSIQDGSSLRILVCTQQHASADAYLDMYRNLTSEREQITIVRLIAEFSRRNSSFQHFYKTVPDFKQEMERNSHRNRLRFLVVTTCLTAKQIKDFLPPWFFTHIFLDEGAQMREPEAVAPLCMVSQKTKIVIAGDKYQVGPAMLVLGEVPQQYGLAVSVLERLYDLYQKVGGAAKPYCAHLSTNFRCHLKILNLARQIAYKMPLQCKVPDHSAHPKAKFPLQFMCSSLDVAVQATDSSVNRAEARVVLEEASRFFMDWPAHNWGKRDLSQICFLSPCRGQVTVARDTTNGLPPQVRAIRKVPTYQIQGQEFRALFVSTSEPTTANGETRDCTKSISDPFVFITALTRAQSLVVAVGNPFLLLKRERHMVAKYGQRGHCWSLFLKACLENDSLSIHPSLGVRAEKVVKQLTQQVDCSISDLDLHVSELPFTVSTEQATIPDVPPVEFPNPPTPKEEEKPPGSHSSRLKKEYELIERLGEGGYGVVYHVHHHISNYDYALKIVDFEKKVEREVEALAGLEHPNIVRYHHSWSERAPATWQRDEPWRYLPSNKSSSDLHHLGVSATGYSESQAPNSSAASSPNISSQSSGGAPEGSGSLSIVFRDSSTEQSHASSRLKPLEVVHQSDPEPPLCLCILTELCDKENLKTWLVNHKDDRKRKYVTDCFVEILEAVKHIHCEGLMHRDLKPSNIFFSRALTQGGERKIKIGDFGFVTTSQAAAVTEAASRSKYVGSALYTSPEQIKKEPYGDKVDIYALGIIYFEMSCPFSTDMERFTVLTKLRDQMKFPVKFEDKLHREAELIRWMLTEDQFARPSADEIATSTMLKTLRKNLRKMKDATVPHL